MTHCMCVCDIRYTHHREGGMWYNFQPLSREKKNGKIKRNSAKQIQIDGSIKTFVYYKVEPRLRLGFPKFGLFIPIINKSGRERSGILSLR